MNYDIQKYDVYILKYGRLIKVDFITDTSCYNHFIFELHHFVEQQMRRKNPTKYAKLEHLQKLILLKRDFHHSLPGMSEERVFKETGVHKWELMYLKSHNYEKENSYGK